MDDPVDKMIATLANNIAKRLLTVYGPGGPAVAIAPRLPDGSFAGEYAAFEIIDAITPHIAAAVQPLRDRIRALEQA